MLKFTSPKINNCYVCLFESKYDFARLFFPFKGHCPHKKSSKSKKFYYEISETIFIFDLFSTIFLSVASLSYFYYFSAACENSKQLCLIFIADETLIVVSFVVVILGFTNLKLQLREFNAWIALFTRRKFYCLKNIISEESALQLMKSREIGMIACFLFLIFEIILSFFVSIDELPYNYIRKFLMTGYYSFQFYICLDFCQKVRIVGRSLDNFKNTIEKTLSDQAYPIFTTKRHRINLEMALKRFSNFFLVLSTNMNLLMDYVTTTIIVFCSAVIGILVINIYLLIESSDFNYYVLAWIELRTLGTIFLIVAVFVTAERNLNAKVSNSKT